MKKKFLLVGLDCANCASKIERGISKIDGVENVSINFLTTKLIIEGIEEKMTLILQETEKIIKKTESHVIIKEIK